MAKQAIPIIQKWIMTHFEFVCFSNCYPPEPEAEIFNSLDPFHLLCPLITLVTVNQSRKRDETCNNYSSDDQASLLRRPFV